MRSGTQSFMHCYHQFAKITACPGVKRLEMLPTVLWLMMNLCHELTRVFLLDVPVLFVSELKKGRERYHSERSNQMRLMKLNTVPCHKKKTDENIK